MITLIILSQFGYALGIILGIYIIALGQERN